MGEPRLLAVKAAMMVIYSPEYHQTYLMQHQLPLALWSMEREVPLMIRLLAISSRRPQATVRGTAKDLDHDQAKLILSCQRHGDSQGGYLRMSIHHHRQNQKAEPQSTLL